MPDAASPLVRLQFLVQGRVQGVGYRNATEDKANQLGVSGWVRNLPDGRVEVCAEGSEALVESLFQWCHRGPLFAKVREVSIQQREVLSAPITAGFKVRR